MRCGSRRECQRCICLNQTIRSCDRCSPIADANKLDCVGLRCTARKCLSATQRTISFMTCITERLLAHNVHAKCCERRSLSPMDVDVRCGPFMAMAVLALHESPNSIFESEARTRRLVRGVVARPRQFNRTPVVPVRSRRRPALRSARLWPKASCIKG